MLHLTRAPIDLASVVASVAGRDRGGIATFLGLVRNHHQGRAVHGIEYTAYEPMAEAECERIVQEARTRWPVDLALAHRLGELAVGDVAVAVVAAGAHRDEAFAACRHVIEEVKRRVPIWKRERYADGTEEWVDPTTAGVGSRESGIGN
ncbi:MAG: molybdenum cofactor biosynthesis protein MoaE [Gemmatimonadales bacterium]